MRSATRVCLAAAGLLAVFHGVSYAHQCQLDGTSAEHISRYNACKADLSVPGMHQNGDDSGLQRDIDRLEAENTRLKAQLDQIRRQLLSVLAEL